MNLHNNLIPLLAIAAGIAILLVPKTFRFILAAYLITIGILGLLH